MDKTHREQEHMTIHSLESLRAVNASSTSLFDRINGRLRPLMNISSNNREEPSNNTEMESGDESDMSANVMTAPTGMREQQGCIEQMLGRSRDSQQQNERKQSGVEKLLSLWSEPVAKDDGHVTQDSSTGKLSLTQRSLKAFSRRKSNASINE